MHQVAIRGELLDRAMGVVQHGHAGRFVHPAALHADETVLDHVDSPDAVAPADRVQLGHHFQRTQLAPVNAGRHARGKTDRQLLHFVWRLLGRDGHPELDQFDAVDR